MWAEIDGAYHMDPDRWWADMARHNQLARRNEVLLRFPAWLVRDRPAGVAAAIRRMLARPVGRRRSWMFRSGSGNETSKIYSHSLRLKMR